MSRLVVMGLVLLGIKAMSYAQAQPDFINHGVGAPVAESRGVVTVRDANGRNLVIALALDMSARGYILVTDVDSEETRQHEYPDGVPNSAPFASLMSANGRFYTGAGKVLLEFDPTSRQWLFHGVPQPQAGCFVGQAMADGPDGLIYIGTCPNSHLVSYDPKTQKMTDYGRLDPQEAYFSYLAFDSAGWAYAGIGTARCNIVAFNPRTGERRQIVPESERVLGTGRVFTSKDGEVYGVADKQWYCLSDGRGEKVGKEEAWKVSPRIPAISWGQTTGTFPDGRTVKYNLPDRWLQVDDPKTGKSRRIPIDYKSGGAMITSLVGGPDGKVYGSSCHPMHFFVFDPQKTELKDLGPVHRVGGGNFCAMAVQGKYIAAASYSHGIFHLFDTTRPFNGGVVAPSAPNDAPNPRELAEWPKDICRPRTVLAHPDGRHVMMAGYAGYGLCGGGLGIYNLETQEAALINHENLIPNQSTITLKALRDGNLVGGTSISAPGGGHPLAKEGVLYILDWPSRKVVYQTAPAPGAAEVSSLEVGPDGLVYGLAGGARFFVFDPKSRQVVHQDDLSAYGGVPRPALINGPDGNIYAIFTKAVVKIEPGTFRHVKLADTPVDIGAGIAVVGGRLFFAGGACVCSHDLKLREVKP